ncbi:NGO_0222 family membrane protein [Neisseria chenwenguii]|uniref:Uncharacterized protein n=1 Tax=Neisseria chenwenguii TaxID=1853278 RepID=A0A220RZC2_9NEIS|nr:NGO_0222 family membrane protein [Neisseria chenwenguii]ASK26523.1 hypothetical protein BG910_01050 [Neisseria chenwenguii]ROV55965.1 hypothetical protein EGS38_07170 [Neisseria chenwenguii]
MKPAKTYLLATAFFTLLFMGLVAFGSYLLSVGSKQYGVAAFLFAFAAVFAQMTCLALFLRQKARSQAAQAQQKENRNA